MNRDSIAYFFRQNCIDRNVYKRQND